MSTPARVTAGVPTGGQFAATSHAEADTVLNSTPRQVVDRAFIVEVDRWDQVFTRADEQRQLASLRAVAEHLRAEYPTARYLRVGDAENGDYMQVGGVLDADENEIAANVDGLRVRDDPAPHIDIGALATNLPCEYGVWLDALAEDPDGDRNINLLDLDRALALSTRATGQADVVETTPIHDGLPLRLSFTPDAVRDHFDGDDGALDGLDDGALRDIGAAALRDDRLYAAFHAALVDAAAERRKQTPVAS